jgi:hypothetical protein
MAYHQISKHLRRRALAVALGVCFVGAALAAETGGLRVTITGNDGVPVPGATIRISSPSSLVAKTAVTGPDGTVTVVGLDPATNYSVAITASGYGDFKAGNIAVVSGQNLSVGYVMGPTTLDAVIVTGTSLAAVDTTSAVVGTTLNLDIVEALPTARSYQSYLQLVPGVKPSTTGNPSSKSGINYADIGGVSGDSSDNVYYLDGVDVTDPETGTFGANFNSEIIQEQQVLTGGIPAEFAGGSGLVSKVITKSGSNEFHGSVNYYFQNDSLVQKNKHQTSNGFSTYDTAVTLGGPIVKDKLWFFGSFQKKSREDDVVNPNTGESLRTVNRDDRLSFVKVTWQPTQNDRLTAEMFKDPMTRSGSVDPIQLNNRDRAVRQGGDNYKLEYSHTWDNFRLGAYGYRHKAELATIPADLATRNDVAFLGGNPTNAELQLGGFGTSQDLWRNRREYAITADYWLDTRFGSHAFRGGFTVSDNESKTDVTRTGPDAATYVSIAAQNAGVSFQDYGGPDWTGVRSVFLADIGPRVIPAIDASPDKAYFYGVLDANHDGALTYDEVAAYRFGSTAGNPDSQVNAYRIQRTVNAPFSVKSKGKTFFLQDSWTLDRWSANVGVRAEQWRHLASDGARLFTFKWEYAPRVSVVYDLQGDGRSKVWGFWGRYYDPIRTNMTNFAGTLTGPVDEEQLFLGDRWLTYRTRGGAATPDAVFSPSTKTPYTDEAMLGYATTFGENLSLSATYTRRITRNLLEDFDLGLYSNPDAGTPAPTGIAGPGSIFYLPYAYFGYAGKPNSNYVIGTLPDGKRKYDGVEVALQKQRSNHWQGMVSYTYNRAHGNSNSDSNADFQGDWVALDPRAPNVWGPQPGNVKHLVKAWGTYFTNFGLEFSGVFNWNSGILYSKTFQTYGRNLPIMQEDASEFGGVVDTWVLPGAVGSQQAPSYYTLDFRAKYSRPIGFGRLELFLDIFNVLNKQSTTNVQSLVAGDGVYAFAQATEWVQPRRAYLGARFSF